MHGKCGILRFKITVFRVMEPCNLTGGYRGLDLGIVLKFFLCPVEIDAECSSKTFATM